ncbi:MAG: PKD domain-containing protein [Bifidobacteriaceae bacterium]|jgi:PKD repeat protein|nr:PKD domain-containing protein [Bifidobacteriaceae bacterium]
MAALAVVGAMGLGGAVTLPAAPSRANANDFMMEYSRYGPNEFINIYVGTLSQGCDGLFRTSDIYVIPAGQAQPGAELNDISGEPNQALGNLLGHGFAFLQIGATYPAGSIPPGIYDVVEDVCEDGRFDDGQDSVLRNAFEVTDPDPLHPPSVAGGLAILNAKAAAQGMADYYTDAVFYWNWFWRIYGWIPGLPRVWDGADAIIKHFLKSGICGRWALPQNIVCRAAVGEIPTIFGTIRFWGAQFGLYQARVYQGLAADPPDLDYTAPVALAPVPPSNLNPATVLDRAVEELYYADWAEAAAVEGFWHALEKYQGAEQTPDAAAALMQAEAAAAYANQAVQALTAKAEARAAMVAVEQAAGGFMSDTAAAQFNELYDRLAGGAGLTAEEKAVLQDLGMGEADMDEFVELVKDEAFTPAPFQTLAELDAEAAAVEADMIEAFEDAAAMFAGFAAELEAGLAAKGYPKYPQLTLAGPEEAGLGETITVTATTAAGNEVAWDTDLDGEFDDATGATASAAFETLGVHRVGALVTDSAGRRAIAYHNVAVRYSDSHPVIVSANPAQGSEIVVGDGEVATIKLTTGHTRGKAVTVTWHVNGQSAGTGDQLDVTGDAVVGVQHVEAELRDADGMAEWAVWGVATAVVAPLPQAGPAASFTFAPGSPAPGQSITFTDTSEAGEGRSITSWAWDFNGDAVTDSTAAAPQHSFSAAGAQTVTLTVTDSAGERDSATREIVVSNPSYLSVYPVAGTATAAEVTVRVKAWEATGWTELSGAEVVISVGEFQVTVTTGAQGTAEARVPRVAGTPVSAQLVGAADGAHGPAADVNDLSTIGKPQGDVVFVVDESTTMGPYQNAVAANLNLIADRLAQSIDYQLGLVGFGTWAHANEREHTHIPATDSLADFAAATASLQRWGANEWGTDAIVYALDSRMGIRPEAASCLVLVADEHTQVRDVSVAQTAQALAEGDAALFSIINPNTNSVDYRDLATNSGGAWFSIADFAADPQPVLDALLTGCVASITQRPDLSVSVDDGLAATPLDRGGTHTVTVVNDGLEAATGVQLRLTLAGAVTVGAVSGSGAVTPAAGGGGEVSWPGFDLAPGASASFTVAWAPAASAAPGGAVVANAQVADDGANGADLSPANNEDADTTALTAVPQQVVSVVYVDDDVDGAQVAPAAGSATSLAGPRLTPVGFTEADARAGVPAGYEFVSLENVDAYDDDDAAQAITVRLRHHHTLWTLLVRRTIDYTGAGEATPQDVAHEVLWNADTDDVTGVTLYWSADGYPEVASPDVVGHDVSHPVVDGTEAVDATAVAPLDSVVVVQYQPLDEPAPTPTPTPTPTEAAATSLPLTGPGAPGWIALAALLGVLGGWALRRMGRLGRPGGPGQSGQAISNSTGT